MIKEVHVTCSCHLSLGTDKRSEVESVANCYKCLLAMDIKACSDAYFGDPVSIRVGTQLSALWKQIRHEQAVTIRQSLPPLVPCPLDTLDAQA
jgi:hypothetical protein